jgi:hypothetical protein
MILKWEFRKHWDLRIFQICQHGFQLWILVLGYAGGKFAVNNLSSIPSSFIIVLNYNAKTYNIQ